MGIGLCSVDGDIARLRLNVQKEDGDLDLIANKILGQPEVCRRAFYLPPGTEFLDAYADLYTDQVIVKMRHPELPFVPDGVAIPNIRVRYRQKGEVIVFQKFEVISSMMIDYSQPSAPAVGVIVYPEWMEAAQPRQPPITEQILIFGAPSERNALSIGGTVNQQPEL